jgi:cation transport ATPase
MSANGAPQDRRAPARAVRKGPSPGAEIGLGGNRLILRSPDLFAGDAGHARHLIEKAFSLDQVRAVVLRRELDQIGIELSPLADAEAVWPRLGALLRTSGPVPSGRAARLDLVGPAAGLPVRVSRAGSALTTFRARVLSSEHLRIGHPLLRQGAIRRRFREFLQSVHGVSEVRGLGFIRPGVLVVFDAAVVDAEQILRLIEGSWAEITDLRSVPVTPRRLFAAGGLLVFSFIAQFFRPLWLPWAIAAAAIYSAPNLIAAARDLVRGRIGLPALYTAGLGFLLWTRLPFVSSLMATLSQTWPSLANRLASDGESRLFAEQRRRVAWARLSDDGSGERVVGFDEVPREAVFVVRAGEYLPADGVVLEGRAAVDEDMLTGARGAVDKIAGDPVYAGSFVRDGALSVRALRSGADTSAAALARSLPRGALKGLPSSQEVERIANRNAKPALAAAALLLLATRAPRLSQVVIRPDYATAPRLSAHLSGLTALAESLARGALVRHPAVLERLRAPEVFVFDEGLDFETRAVEIAKVNVVSRAAADQALQLAAAALIGRDDPRAEALRREVEDDDGAPVAAHGLRQRAGQTIFWDEAGALVSVAGPELALAEEFAASASLAALLQKFAAHPSPDPFERPLVVARDRKVLAVVQFARTGERRLANLIAGLRRENPDARFVHVSARSQDEAENATEDLGLDAVYGGLDAQGKAQVFRSLGVPAAWIGDGADRSAAPARAASAVSISLSGLDSLARDEADIVLLRDDVGALLAPRIAAALHVNRIQADYRTVYFANLLAVAGGFAAGFGSLQAGLTSNLGSAAVFLGRWRALAGLAARAQRRAEGRRQASNNLAAELALSRIARRREGGALRRHESN